MSDRSRRKKAPSTAYLTPEAQKSLADRLARAEGHLRSVRQMVVDHRCADDILIQIAAVKAAVNRAAAALIESEMRSCVQTCMEGSTEDRLDRIARALAAVMKSS